MKISNSKKQLAKIISENCGWPHEARWAAQCKSDSTVSFYGGEAPKRAENCWWGSHCEGRDISVDQVPPNWHQTILSRDEYFHLHPAPDADGWIEWKGGECPVEKGALVDVRYRNGKENIGVTALLHQEDDGFASARESGDYDLAVDWDVDGCDGDIAAYRRHKQEQVAHKPECIVIEQEPTIEQLAADYKAKLAIAQKAQEEADSHRCGAEAALERLYQAGLAIGLDIAIADSEQEGENRS